MPNCIICTEKLESGSPNDETYFNIDKDLVVDSEGRSKVSATSCGHLFHASCIAKWLETTITRKQCPICNKEITMGSITTIYADWGYNNDGESDTILNDESSIDGHESIHNEKTRLIQENFAYKLQMESISQELARSQQTISDLTNEVNRLNEQFYNGKIQFEKLNNEKENISRQLEMAGKNFILLENKNRILQKNLDNYKRLQEILTFKVGLHSQQDKLRSFLNLNEEQKAEIYLTIEKERNEAVKKNQRIERELQGSLIEITNLKSSREEALTELMRYKRIEENSLIGGTKLKARPMSTITVNDYDSNSRVAVNSSNDTIVKVNKKSVPSNLYLSSSDTNSYQ